VHLLDVDAHDNVVQGNFIGTDRTGVKQIGNQSGGVLIKNAAKNLIGGTVDGAGNTIRFNNGAGVTVVESVPNQAKLDAIRGNGISDNAGLGIDLGDDGVTPNDPGDGDPGANKLQNRPIISSVVASAGSLTITGRLRSAPNKTYQIDLFANN
ncbi:MAG: Calx-beta domain-containing protein, partial [Chthoniobacterales bacterium]